MIRIKGKEEIERVLRGLPDQVNDRILQAARAKALKPLVERAHYLAPVYKTGNLAESIGVVKTSFKTSGGKGEVMAGPRRRGGYKGFAGHLVEYGTRNRRTRRGANRGKVKAKPFMEPAWEQTKDQVKNRIVDELGKTVTNYIRRTAR